MVSPSRTASPTFEFINYEDRDKDSLKRMKRRHVMQAFLRQQQSDQRKTLKIHSLSTVTTPLAWRVRRKGDDIQTDDSDEPSGDITTESDHDRFITFQPKKSKPIPPKKTTPMVVVKSSKPAHKPAPSIHQTPTPNAGTGCRVDPFRNLPFELTDDEQHLLQTYFSYTSSQLYDSHNGKRFSEIRKMSPATVGQYNSRPRGRFDPIRDICFPSNRISPVVLHWLLMSAEYLLTLRGEMSRIPNIFQRRGLAYHLINETLADPVARYTDASMAAVAAAVAVEARYMTKEVTRVHMIGLDQMLRARGGPETLKHDPILNAVVAWSHFLCHGGVVQDDQEFITLREALFSSLNLLQIYHGKRGQANGSSQGVNPKKVMIGFNNTSESWDRRINTIFQVVFGPGSRLRRYFSEVISADNSPLFSSPKNAFHIVALSSVLFNLNLVVYQYRDDPENLVTFFETLNEIFESSLPENTTTEAIATLLTSDIVVSSMGYAARESNFKRVWKVVDFLKVMARISPEEKFSILHKLSLWLLNLGGPYASSGNGMMMTSALDSDFGKDEDEDEDF